jgi:hypothetical protein
MGKYEIDQIIELMQQYTTKKTDGGEIGEQDAPAGGSTTGAGSTGPYPTVTKWESGVVRGPGNQIGLTKWRDIVKITRGKANTLL